MKALVKGLQVSIIKKSEWQIDNAFSRLDSEYQIKEYRAAIEKVRSKGAQQLLEAAPEIIHPHELKREFVDEGTWFLRAQNVRPMRIDPANRVYLPTDVAQMLTRNRLLKGDVLVTRTGANRGDCAVFDSDLSAVASSHTFIVRNDLWRQSYLMAFLNSYYGRAQIDKGVYGAAQPEIAPYYLQRIWIPSASVELQDGVDVLIELASSVARESNIALDQAETTLLNGLGLGNWTPNEALSYISGSAVVRAAARLDAQYYQSAKLEMLARLRSMPGAAPLRDSFDVVRDLVDPRKNPVGRCRNYDLTDALHPVLDATKEPGTFADMESQKVRMANGDLAVSRLRSYLREIAVVKVDDDIPSVGSSEFYVLRLKDGAPDFSAEALMIYLRSPPVQTILKWCQDGSQHPRFAEKDLMGIPLPESVLALNGVLTATVQHALSKRAQSLGLLEAVKFAIDLAIDEDETAALRFIAKEREAIGAGSA